MITVLVAAGTALFTWVVTSVAIGRNLHIVLGDLPQETQDRVVLRAEVRRMARLIHGELR